MAGRNAPGRLVRGLATVLTVALWAGIGPPGHRPRPQGPQDVRPAGRSLPAAPPGGIQGARAAAADAAASSAWGAVTTGTEAPAAVQARVEAAYGQLPLSFEANRGQTDGQVKFLARSLGSTLFLTATEAVLALHQPAPRALAPVSGERAPSPSLSPWARVRGLAPDQSAPPPPPIPPEPRVLRLTLVGANPAPRVVGLEELPGKANYFLGNDPTRWRTNVPTYAKVHYQEVYPGIDLVYYGNPRQVEFDLVVAPGADPSAITLAFEGADSLVIDAQGDLRLHTAGGEVRLRQPHVYQTLDGRRQAIAARYVRRPPLEIPSPLMGEGSGGGETIAPFPPHPDLPPPGGKGPLPILVSPLTGEGEGGGGGLACASPPPASSPTRGEDACRGEGQGEEKPQVGFEVAPYDGSRPLVIDPVLSFSTYLGGSGTDQGLGIAVDAAGNAYVTGVTNSANFPTVAPLQGAIGGISDAFVAKFNAAGAALVYATYLGGSGTDQGRGIAVDASGNAYVGGLTQSADFPTTTPLQGAFGGLTDAFVAKLNAAGAALVYATYLGGSGIDQGRGIAVDASGNAYVTGLTDSADFPTAAPLQGASDGETDAFVAKLNAAGAALVYATYLGGSLSDEGRGIAVDAAGNAYVTGVTGSANFPTATPLQGAIDGSFDAFVAKIGNAPPTVTSDAHAHGSTGLPARPPGADLAVCL